jgi:hypothetical protein
MTRYDSFSEAISFCLVGLSAIACKECSYIFENVLQSIEECIDIKEKVKKYIAKRNAREGVASSGSGNADAPLTPAIEILAEQGTSAPSKDAAQDGVDN